MTECDTTHLATVPMGPLSNSSAPTVLLKARRRLPALSVLADHTAAYLPLAFAPVAIGEPDATPVAHLSGGSKETVRVHDAGVARCSAIFVDIVSIQMIRLHAGAPGDNERGVGLGSTHAHGHHLAGLATRAHQAIALQHIAQTALQKS